MDELSVAGAWVLRPTVWRDRRGSFFEFFKAQQILGDLGYHLEVAQVNCSVSRRGAIRGIHFADVPPGQAKYVACVNGAILDVVVDLRTGSPTFQRWDAVRLDDEQRNALLISEGLGHAFMALSEEATVIYLCSTPYDPDHERAIHPLDPDIGITWPESDEVILSDKDAAAPTLTAISADGLLPAYAACVKLRNAG